MSDLPRKTQAAGGFRFEGNDEGDFTQTWLLNLDREKYKFFLMTSALEEFEVDAQSCLKVCLAPRSQMDPLCTLAKVPLFLSSKIWPGSISSIGATLQVSSYEGRIVTTWSLVSQHPFRFQFQAPPPAPFG